MKMFSTFRDVKKKVVKYQIQMTAKQVTFFKYNKHRTIVLLNIFYCTFKSSSFPYLFLKVPITPKHFFQGKEYLHFSEQNAEKIFDFG